MEVTMDGKELLKKVLDERLTPELWRPYMVERYNAGDHRRVGPINPEYAKGCGCLLQALYRANIGRSSSAEEDAIGLLRKALIKRDPSRPVPPIGNWNDEHTLDEVRALVEEAIAL